MCNNNHYHYHIDNDYYLTKTMTYFNFFLIFPFFFLKNVYYLNSDLNGEQFEHKYSTNRV